MSHFLLGFRSLLSLISPLSRAVAQEYRRSGDPPIPWPGLARFTRKDMRSKPGMRGSRLRGNDRGVNPGPIWLCLASFTPSRAMEMRPVWPRFGSPLTRTRWASRPWLWPWLASSGVPRSGETFISVSYSLIESHSLSPEPSSSPSPMGRRDLSFAGMTRCLRVNDVHNQCTGWLGDGAMGSCRLFLAHRRCVGLHSPLSMGKPNVAALLVSPLLPHRPSPSSPSGPNVPHHHKAVRLFTEPPAIRTHPSPQPGSPTARSTPPRTPYRSRTRSPGTGVCSRTLPARPPCARSSSTCRYR